MYEEGLNNSKFVDKDIDLLFAFIKIIYKLDLAKRGDIKAEASVTTGQLLARIWKKIESKNAV